MHASAKQVISPHIVTYTCRIVHIGSNKTRLHNIAGCLMIRAPWIWKDKGQSPLESRTCSHLFFCPLSTFFHKILYVTIHTSHNFLGGGKTNLHIYICIEIPLSATACHCCLSKRRQLRSQQQPAPGGPGELPPPPQEPTRSLRLMTASQKLRKY